MKRYFRLLCFVSLTALALTSCQKESVHDIDNPILGQWRAVNVTWNDLKCSINLNITNPAYDADLQDTACGYMQVMSDDTEVLKYRVLNWIYTPETQSGQFIVEDASFGDRGMNPMFYYDEDEDLLRVIDVYFNLTFRRVN